MSKQKTEKQFLYTTCSEHEFMNNSMNNLLSYCGLTDARMRASGKDLPVKYMFSSYVLIYFYSLPKS